MDTLGLNQKVISTFLHIPKLKGVGGSQLFTYSSSTIKPCCTMWVWVREDSIPDLGLVS